MPGAQMRYFVRAANAQPLAVLGFGAAAWKTAPRDAFIGWSPAVRQRNLALVVNNARFLILPWIRIHNLASHLLAQLQRRLPLDWERRYALRPVLLETFCETPRFLGTCYQSANWLCVGETQGRGKLDVHRQSALPVKSVWLKPCPRVGDRDRRTASSVSPMRASISSIMSTSGFALDSARRASVSRSASWGPDASAGLDVRPSRGRPRRSLPVLRAVTRRDLRLQRARRRAISVNTRLPPDSPRSLPPSEARRLERMPGAISLWPEVESVVQDRLAAGICPTAFGQSDLQNTGTVPGSRRCRVTMCPAGVSATRRRPRRSRAGRYRRAATYAADEWRASK